MKRSEILKLIEGLFELASRSEFDNKTNAENLLSTLEEKGMQPSKRLIKIHHIKMDHEGELNIIEEYANSWEPEGQESCSGIYCKCKSCKEAINMSKFLKK